MEEITDETIVHEVVTRLSERNSALDPGYLNRLVSATLHRYSGAHIRTFLPVLVERDVTELLRAGPAPG